MEHAEMLRKRLEDAERTIEQLRSMVGVRGQEEAARNLLNYWQNSVEETLKAQSDWMRGLWGNDTNKGDKTRAASEAAFHE